MKMNKLKLKKAYKLLVFLSRGDLRKKIYNLLEEYDYLNVTEIMIKARVEQCRVSSILREGRKLGVYEKRRQGKYIFYSINYSRILQVKNVLDEFFDNKKYPIDMDYNEDGHYYSHVGFKICSNCRKKFKGNNSRKSCKICIFNCQNN